MSTHQRILIDHLLELLSDHQVFLQTVQRYQWNFRGFTPDDYNLLINHLFNCSEELAHAIYAANGSVPAHMAVYLELSQIADRVEVTQEIDEREYLIDCHRKMLDYFLKFINDDIQHPDTFPKELIGKLYIWQKQVLALLNNLASPTYV